MQNDQPAEFLWDEGNIYKVLQRNITLQEFEEVCTNQPFEVQYRLEDDEPRIRQLGETDAGRVLFVVSTPRDGKIRPITAWPAGHAAREQYALLKEAYERAQDPDVPERGRGS